MTEVEMKARAYDILVQMESLQRELQRINVEIVKIQQQIPEDQPTDLPQDSE